MLVSFIIPAYNASGTITRCLDSIYRLALEDHFEIIVIDDCSTDNTVDIIREYLSSIHSNISLLIQPHNNRQGAARNRGVSVAKGKYICFVDSDDEVDQGLFSAIKIAEKNSLEMVALKAQKVSSKKSVSYSFELPYANETMFSGVTLQSEHPFWCTAPWGYLYLREFIWEVGYPFAENVLYEDSDFVCAHLIKAKKMGYCNERGYIVHENPKSITHTTSFYHTCDYALLGTRMINLYHQIEDRDTSLANSILEGGSYNIMRSFKNIFKLKSYKDVKSFYDRFDNYYDREKLLQYRTPKYCWTIWTRFCLKYRLITIYLVGFIISINTLRFKE